MWQPRYIDAPICRDTLDSNGNVRSPTTGRIYSSATPTTTLPPWCNTAGGSVGGCRAYAYDPYGNVTIYTARLGAARFNILVGQSNTIFFAGESFDTATGLYFDNARYYDPQLGRFISRDPMPTTPAAAITSTPIAATTRQMQQTPADFGAWKATIGSPPRSSVRAERGRNSYRKQRKR